MKLTKTLTMAAFVVAGLLAGSTALQAQDAAPAAKHHGKAGMHARPNIDQIAKNLGLTEDQKTQFQKALENEQTKMKELRKDSSLSKEDKRAKAKEIREATQAKIKEILTPEQLKKMRQEMKHNRKGEKKAPKKD